MNYLQKHFSLFVCAVVGACLMFVSPEVFAQTTPTPTPPPSPVDLEPIVEFGSLFATIRDTIAPLVVGALGLGLAIWAARYIFSIIKSMGR